METALQLREIKFEVTYRCPLRCVHCSSDAEPVHQLDVGRDAALRILGEAAAMGVGDVAFSGGEPFLWDHLVEAVTCCTRSGMSTTVYTSGNVEGVAPRLRELRRAGLSTIIFSVYASAPDVHDSVTMVPGSYERSIASLREARALGFRVEAHFVPMARTYQHLAGIIETAIQECISKVSVLRLVPQGRGSTSPEMGLTRDQAALLTAEILLGRSRLPIRTGSPFNVMAINNPPRCMAAQDRLTIAPDLRVHPCDAFKRVGPVALVGSDEYSNLKFRPLRECWEKSAYLQLVRAAIRDSLGPRCSCCPRLERCMGGCLAQRYLADGVLERGPDPWCPADEEQVGDQRGRSRFRGGDCR